MWFILFQQSNYTGLFIFFLVYRRHGLVACVSPILVSIFLEIVLNFDLLSWKPTMLKSVIFLRRCQRMSPRLPRPVSLSSAKQSRKQEQESPLNTPSLIPSCYFSLFSKMEGTKKKKKKNPFPNQQ